MTTVGSAADKPATPQAEPKPTPAPTQQTAPRPAPPTSNGRPKLDVVCNTAFCARYGGPVAGAICGILTPTPAYQRFAKMIASISGASTSRSSRA